MITDAAAWLEAQAPETARENEADIAKQKAAGIQVIDFKGADGTAYAAEVHFFRRKGYSIDIVQFPETDFAAVARGYGASAATVRTLADLEPLRGWVEKGAPGLFVIDGRINPDLEADWHAEHFP